MSALHEGLPVAGYRQQPTAAVDLVNRNTAIEERILRILDDLRSMPRGAVDPRWLAAGRTDIEKGFMAINRAIFQPERVNLPGDDQI